MSTDIKPGQKVRKARGASLYNTPSGHEFTVAAVVPAGSDFLDVDVITLEGYEGWGFLPDEFEPVEVTPAPLDPAKIRVGATVTVTVDDGSIGSYEVTGEVRGHLGGTWSVGPINVASNGTWHEGVTLTAHTPAAEPEPEWKPGTVADITVDFDTYRAIRSGSGWHTDTDRVLSIAEVDEVSPLVVIDLAKVNEAALLRAFDDLIDYPEYTTAGRLAGIRAVLAELGLDAAIHTLTENEGA